VLVSRPGKWDVSDKAEALTRAGDDSKRWGRVSIRLRTHPLHRFPRVSQKDFLLPQRSDLLRLLGDCFVVGVAFAGLAFFPLLLVALATPHDVPGFWWFLGVFGLAGAVYVFCRGWSPDVRELDRY
jgi:hypothetical protein